MSPMSRRELHGNGEESEHNVDTAARSQLAVLACLPRGLTLRALQQASWTEVYVTETQTNAQSQALCSDCF